MEDNLIEEPERIISYGEAQLRIDIGLPVEVIEEFVPQWTLCSFRKHKPGRYYRVPLVNIVPKNTERVSGTSTLTMKFEFVDGLGIKSVSYPSARKTVELFEVEGEPKSRISFEYENTLVNGAVGASVPPGKWRVCLKPIE